VHVQSEKMEARAISIRLMSISMKVTHNVFVSNCNVTTGQHTLLVTMYFISVLYVYNKCPQDPHVKCANQETDQAHAMVALGV